MTPGLPSEILTQRPDIRHRRRGWHRPPPISAARGRNSIEHPADRQWRLEHGAVIPVPAAAFCSAGSAANRSSMAAPSSASNSPGQAGRVCRPIARPLCSPLPMSTTHDCRARDHHQVAAARRRRRRLAAGHQLAGDQLRAGTADIVTVLNVQTTLFQAEDSLVQAQLARLQAIVSLYQALGGGWEPRMERAVNAL